MTTEMRADRWKMQNSKIGSRNITMNRCVRKTTVEIASITIAVVCHDATSRGSPLDKVTQKNGRGPSIKRGS